MPLNASNSLGSLEVNDAGVPASFLAKLNDRLRRISNLVASTSQTSLSSTTQVSGAASGELILTVPGTLAVESNAAAAVTLGENTKFSTLIALVKQAPQGAAITLQLYAGGNPWGPQISIAANATAAQLNVSGVAAIPANALIRLDITQVGATLSGQSFPGSDLTVILR